MTITAIAADEPIRPPRGRIRDFIRRWVDDHRRPMPEEIWASKMERIMADWPAATR